MSVLKIKKDGVWESVSGISGHTHTIDDITNFPEIKPDGGDADTVDGKHASDFASASSLLDLAGLVGDESVASQISTAIIDATTEIKSYSDSGDTSTLEAANTHTDEVVAQKTQVQIITLEDSD